MASVSLSLTVAQATTENPQDVTTGVLAPGAGDIELRVNTANITNLGQAVYAIRKFLTFIEDTNLGPAAFGEL
jgi:hypothetical protein